MDKSLKIGIVGLGLIGGSIQKRLNDTGKYELLLVSKSQGSNLELKNLGSCDLVFLCGEQSSIPAQLAEIAKLKAQASKDACDDFKNTIITDAASTKVQICETAKNLGLENFIGGHPMAGTEKQGYEASFPELFEEATWVLTESNSKTEVLEKVITEDLKAKITVMDAATHDKSVAAISHLPLVLSLGLAEALNQVPTAAKVIGPGFKSMTRLAKGNEKLGREMIGINRENISELWEAYKTYVDSLLKLPQSALSQEMTEIKEKLLNN